MHIIPKTLKQKLVRGESFDRHTAPNFILLVQGYLSSGFAEKN